MFMYLIKKTKIIENWEITHKHMKYSRMTNNWEY